MVTVDDFSRLVSGIYAAAVTPRHWLQAIHDIHRVLDATGGAMVVADGSARSNLSTSLSSDARKSYDEYYRHIDYVLAAVETGPVGLIRSGSELVRLNSGSEFDTDWMQPNQVDDGLFVRLTNGATPTCFVVAAPRRSEPFDTPERVKLMSALVVHLQQALQVQAQLSAATAHDVTIWDAIDLIRHGAIIVGSEGQVINLNYRAELIVRSNDGVSIVSGRIEIANTHAERELQRAIHAALLGRQSGIRSGHTFLCARRSGKRPFVIHVMPFHRTGAYEYSRHPAALIVVKDPERETEPVTMLLRRFYGLTVGEAEVAVRLTAGPGLREIADELSVSYQTVRTHLQHVFDKTDTHRQAELVRLLLALGS